MATQNSCFKINGMISHSLDHQRFIQRTNYINGIMRVAVWMHRLCSAQKAQITSSSIIGHGVASCQMTIEVIVLKVLSIYIEVTIWVVRALDPNLKAIEKLVNQERKTAYYYDIFFNDINDQRLHYATLEPMVNGFYLIRSYNDCRESRKNIDLFKSLLLIKTLLISSISLVSNQYQLRVF